MADRTGRQGIGPTPPAEREPVLDALRGFALLGILLVNIGLMRGADLYTLLAGGRPEPATGIDRGLDAAISWLAAGKFVSSFALLFGAGTALMADRAVGAGHSPRRLLARRYLWLLAFGLAHMVLLFPGDILFVYALTGLVMLAFLDADPRTAGRWSAGLLGAVTLIAVALAGLTSLIESVPAPGDGDAFVPALEGFFAHRGEQAVAAFTRGDYLDVIGANAFQALIVQSGQLVVMPWLLGLFLLGFAATRAGITLDLAGHRPLLRRAALLGLGLGLPLNAVLGRTDPVTLIAGGSPDPAAGPWLPMAVAVVQQLGAPLLAIGYLSGLALFCLAFGVIAPLTAVGRMALTAYLLQSLFALVVFAGLGLYDQLDTGAAMIVVLAIWSALLAFCPLWLRHFRMGPAEWLWRSLTYGRGQPLRRDQAA